MAGAADSSTARRTRQDRLLARSLLRLGPRLAPQLARRRPRLRRSRWGAGRVGEQAPPGAAWSRPVPLGAIRYCPHPVPCRSPRPPTHLLPDPWSPGATPPPDLPAVHAYAIPLSSVARGEPVGAAWKRAEEWPQGRGPDLEHVLRLVQLPLQHLAKALHLLRVVRLSACNAIILRLQQLFPPGAQLRSDACRCQLASARRPRPSGRHAWTRTALDLILLLLDLLQPALHLVLLRFSLDGAARYLAPCAPARRHPDRRTASLLCAPLRAHRSPRPGAPRPCW